MSIANQGTGSRRGTFLTSFSLIACGTIVKAHYRPLHCRSVDDSSIIILYKHTQKILKTKFDQLYYKKLMNAREGKDEVEDVLKEIISNI